MSVFLPPPKGVLISKEEMLTANKGGRRTGADPCRAGLTPTEKPRLYTATQPYMGVDQTRVAVIQDCDQKANCRLSLWTVPVPSPVMRAKTLVEFLPSARELLGLSPWAAKASAHDASLGREMPIALDLIHLTRNRTWLRSAIAFLVMGHDLRQ